MFLVNTRLHKSTTLHTHQTDLLEKYRIAQVHHPPYSPEQFFGETQGCASAVPTIATRPSSIQFSCISLKTCIV